MRRILRDERVWPDDCHDEYGYVHLKLCGPSDRHPEESQDVVIIEWRSPLGDDLRVTLDRGFVARFVADGPSTQPHQDKTP